MNKKVTLGALVALGFLMKASSDTSVSSLGNAIVASSAVAFLTLPESISPSDG